MNKLADEALEQISKEDDELTIIKKQVRRPERKNEAFEKETFDIFEDYIDSDQENDPEDSKQNDTKKRMYRSMTNGFMSRRDSELVSQSELNDRTMAFDDSDSLFRSSLKGFFTGRSTQKSTIHNSAFSTRETNEYSSLVENNDQAFAGNPLKALKHKRKNMFVEYGAADLVEAKGIEQLINDFSSSASNFKNSMRSIDFAEKLRLNKASNKLNDYMEMSEPQKSVSSTIPKDKIKIMGG